MIACFYFRNSSGVQPKFKYVFRDTGLGTADPIYPIYQKGFQKSWLQLIPALWSEQKRHIDHYSEVETPEGCTVYSAYWVRHIDEFPDRWHDERAAGYTLVDTGFDYYESTNPDAECGKHKVNLPVSEENNPIYQLKKYADSFDGYESLPDELINKVESKIGLLKLVNEEFSRTKWTRYDDLYNLQDNSMWYYIDGIENYYGHNKTIPQLDLIHATKPSDYFIETNSELSSKLKLNTLINNNEFNKLVSHLKGNPDNRYQSVLEPGGDHFSISQVNKINIYTSGLELWNIKNIEQTISNPNNYKLVSMVIRPYEEVDDYSFKKKIIPEMRFVFQLHDPEANKLTEQVFIHLTFDGVDRNVIGPELKKQHRSFLMDYDQVVANANKIIPFINKYKERGVQKLNFSSSLTGIWVFGSLSKTYNPDRVLESVKIQRQGVDVGYYSTAWDSILIRAKMEETNGLTKATLQEHLDALTPDEYRDPKRHDVNKITFNEMTCAGCHQMSARDGVHMAINDNVDPRFTSNTRVTEYMIKELARQLQFGADFWKE